MEGFRKTSHCVIVAVLGDDLFDLLFVLFEPMLASLQLTLELSVLLQVTVLHVGEVGIGPGERRGETLHSLGEGEATLSQTQEAFHE